MGTYYCVACDELKEKIDPGDINNCGVKQGSIGSLDHPIGAVSVFAMCRRWRHKEIRLAYDSADDPGYDEYTDVTKEVLEEYNKEYKTDLTYTGSD